MAHHLQAIVGAAAVVARATELGLTHAPIPLAAGLAWVPVPHDDLDRLAETTTLARSPWDDRFVQLGGVLPAILTALSAHGAVAYIETEYFGGFGTQVATAFVRGARVLDCASVNDALRVLGVRAAPGRDEWDTVGLAAHRTMPGR